MDTPEPDYRRHTEILEGIAMSLTVDTLSIMKEQLDRIEKLVGGGEVQILQKKNEQLFAEVRKLYIVIDQAYEALEDMDDITMAREILLRKGDSGNGSYRSTT